MLSESLTTTNAPVAYQVRDLRFEHLQDARGIGVTQPRLSWITTTPAQTYT